MSNRTEIKTFTKEEYSELQRSRLPPETAKQLEELNEGDFSLGWELQNQKRKKKTSIWSFFKRIGWRRRTR